MAFWHGEKGKKKTGGTIKLARGKRKHELGSVELHTKIGKEKRIVSERKMKNIKVRLVSAEFANVLNPKDGSMRKMKILDIVSNSANQHYVRRLIVTKGAIIKTESGNARVISRPSQSGVVNAIKVE
jgi:small subunit ribosomal protein S8e